MRPILFFILFICFSSSAYSQGTFTGCRYNNVVYTTISSGTRYNSNGTSPKTLSTNYCDWTPATGTSCTICTGGNGMWSGSACSGMGKVIRSGLRNTFTMVPCPIDNSIVFVCFSLVLTSGYLIRLKKSITLV